MATQLNSCRDPNRAGNLWHTLPLILDIIEWTPSSSIGQATYKFLTAEVLAKRCRRLRLIPAELVR